MIYVALLRFYKGEEVPPPPARLRWPQNYVGPHLKKLVLIDILDQCITNDIFRSGVETGEIHTCIYPDD